MPNDYKNAHKKRQPIGIFVEWQSKERHLHLPLRYVGLVAPRVHNNMVFLQVFGWHGYGIGLLAALRRFYLLHNWWGRWLRGLGFCGKWTTAIVVKACK